MTHHHNQQTPEADRCRGVDRSLLEFLKPKAEERYSKLEAYCDLLSKASSGAYQSQGTDGALQLLPGQFVATIPNLPVSGNGSVLRFASLSPDSPNLVSFP